MSKEAVLGKVPKPRGQTYPLNSKRLGAAYLHRIAAELGLPTTASLEDVRQMIDGKLLEESKEPKNVQVTVGVDEVIDSARCRRDISGNN